MQALEVPQSASMQGYLAAGDFDNACKVRSMLSLFEVPRQESYNVRLSCMLFTLCVCAAAQPQA